MTSTKTGSSQRSDKSSEAHGTDPAAGQKGVSQQQVGGGKQDDPNNFASDHERAAAAGRKGGKHSHEG